MAATEEERQPILGVPDCQCGGKMQLSWMEPEENGIVEHWMFRCPKCGANTRVRRERKGVTQVE